MVHIEWHDKTPERVDLMNLSGQLINTIENNSEQGIDISVANLPKGVYVLRLSYANRSNNNYKLIIQ